jgi:hypothetical protein
LGCQIEKEKIGRAKTKKIKEIRDKIYLFILDWGKTFGLRSLPPSQGVASPLDMYAHTVTMYTKYNMM